MVGFLNRHPRLQHKILIPICLLFILAPLTLTGCLTVKFIGDYDAAIDTGITAVQQKFELYFAKLNSTPDTQFDQGFYDDISAALSVLKTRSQATPLTGLITQQIEELQASFDDLQKLDKLTARPIKTDPSTKTTPFTNAKTGIEVPVESILKLEIALKRGVTPDSKTSTSLK